MNIQVTIGVTPQLEKALLGLASLAGAFTEVKQEVQQAAEQHTAPVQTHQQPSPGPTQQAPTQQPNVQAVPTATPEQAPVQQPSPQAQTVPTSAPTYDMNQLAVAATQLMDAGKQQDLMNLLNSFNVQALTSLPQEQYGAFATKLRELGAKI